MKKIAIVLLDSAYCVPQKKGGAVETLMTILLEENEKRGQFYFVIISPNEEDMVLEYEYARCYLCSDKKEEKCIDLDYTSRMIENNLVDKYTYDCKAALIAKKEKVDYVIMEGTARRINGCFDEVVPREKLALHLHNEITLTKVYREEFDRVIVPSQYIAEWWNKEIDDSNINKYLLQNCIRLEKFDKKLSDEHRKNKRNQFGFSQEDFVVLFCGRIIKEKGIKELIDSILMIKNKNIKLMIIGSDSFAYGNKKEFASNITQLVKDNSDRIIYLGYIDNNELSEYYQCADVHVVPSTWEEPFGLVALEGMMSELPVIITNSGGMLEFVPEYAGIRVIKEDNLVGQLKKAILWVYNHKKESCEMARLAKEQAKRYSAENYYLDFCEIMECWENE